MIIWLPLPVNMLLLTENEVIPTREFDSVYPRIPLH